LRKSPPLRYQRPLKIQKGLSEEVQIKEDSNGQPQGEYSNVLEGNSKILESKQISMRLKIHGKYLARDVEVRVFLHFFYTQNLRAIEKLFFMDY
jgi:hypothetical protein